MSRILQWLFAASMVAAVVNLIMWAAAGALDEQARIDEARIKAHVGRMEK